MSYAHIVTYRCKARQFKWERSAMSLFSIWRWDFQEGSLKASRGVIIAADIKEYLPALKISCLSGYSDFIQNKNRRFIVTKGQTYQPNKEGPHCLQDCSKYGSQVTYIVKYMGIMNTKVFTLRMRWRHWEVILLAIWPGFKMHVHSLIQEAREILAWILRPY